MVRKMDQDLDRYRRGEMALVDEQVNFQGIIYQASNLDFASLEAERERLFQHLHDKDEVISQQSVIEKLKKHIMDQDECIANAHRDYQNLESEMAHTQQDNKNAREEAGRIMEALEELAVNYGLYHLILKILFEYFCITH